MSLRAELTSLNDSFIKASELNSRISPSVELETPWELALSPCSKSLILILQVTHNFFPGVAFKWVFFDLTTRYRSKLMVHRLEFVIAFLQTLNGLQHLFRRLEYLLTNWYLWWMQTESKFPCLPLSSTTRN